MSDFKVVEKGGRKFVVVKSVYLSFPKLIAPDQFEPGAAKRYSASFLIPDGHDAIDGLKSVIEELSKEHLQGRKVAPTRRFLKKVEGSSMEGRTGDLPVNWYFTAARRADFGRPKLIIGNTIVKDEERLREHFYPGALVSVAIAPWVKAQPQAQINAGLEQVKWESDGKPLVTTVAADELWDEEIKEEDEADDDVF